MKEGDEEGRGAVFLFPYRESRAVMVLQVWSMGLSVTGSLGS